MEKVLKITSLKDPENDYAFWLTKSEKERIEAIEFLRSNYIQFKQDVQPRLQRVCNVITKK